jgi:bifunctional ADP-heptose synthase (sugar kinase/adenylyltransferase)
VIRRLNAQGIDTEAVACAPSKTTIVKERIMSAGQLLARFDERPESLARSLRAVYDRCDAILIADHDKAS